MKRLMTTMRLLYWWLFVKLHKHSGELVEQVTFTQWRITDAGIQVSAELLATWDTHRLLQLEDFYDQNGDTDQQRAAQFLVTIGKFTAECEQAFQIRPVRMLEVLVMFYREVVLCSLRLGVYA